MAIAFVQANGSVNGSGTSTPAAYTSSKTAGNLLVAVVATYTITDAPTISDTQGNTWSSAILYSSNSFVAGAVRIFYAPNCKAGANTVTGVWQTSGNGELHISEFSGAATSSPLDKTSSGTGSGTTASTTAVTTTANGELIWGWAAGATTACTPGSGFTLVSNQNSGDESEYMIQTSAGSISATWSTSGSWICAMATFLAPGAGGTVSRLGLLGCGQ